MHLDTITGAQGIRNAFSSYDTGYSTCTRIVSAIKSQRFYIPETGATRNRSNKKDITVKNPSIDRRQAIFLGISVFIKTQGYPKAIHH